jgi:hypothetical protein
MATALTRGTAVTRIASQLLLPTPVACAHVNRSPHAAQGVEFVGIKAALLGYPCDVFDAQETAPVNRQRQRMGQGVLDGLPLMASAAATGFCRRPLQTWLKPAAIAADGDDVAVGRPERPYQRVISLLATPLPRGAGSPTPGRQQL